MMWGGNREGQFKNHVQVWGLTKKISSLTVRWRMTRGTKLGRIAKSSILGEVLGNLVSKIYETSGKTLSKE